MVVRARLATFNREQEEAAKDLGAGQWQAFRDVLVPHIKPALVSGALLAFTLSLDDFVITFFTSTPGTDTFPVLVVLAGQARGYARHQRRLDHPHHSDRAFDRRRPEIQGVKALADAH